ncbi:MAG: hypothetical protein DRI71_06910 [Bacteroidetes bacterium]|nr:MAG: hypothetical protein DRI71_06910 [Bacteroidota bacterium]
MKKIFGVFLIVIFSSTVIYGQGNDYAYTSESIWGINKNSASGLIGGFIFRFSRSVKPNHYRTIGFELINVKHPAESRVVSRTGNYFIVGKKNYLYALRGQYGRDIVLFKKASQQGVQITATGSVGPSIGLEAPYYIELNQYDKAPYDPSNPAHSIDNISGSGFMFQGLFESNVVIGLNIRAGLSFEFGTFKSNVSGFEIGTLIDAYARKIDMIPEADNYAVWPTVYITLFYGSRK